MKLVRTVATAVAMSVIAGAALSAPLKLQPANPQPSPKAGLNVKYLGTGNQHKKIRDLSQAKSMLSKAKPGKPLRGLDYRDTSKGEDVLTLKVSIRVAALREMARSFFQNAGLPPGRSSKVRKARFSATLMRGAQALRSGSSGK